MTLQSIIGSLVLVEVVAIGVALVLIVGRSRIRSAQGEVVDRVATALPYLLVLGSLLVLNNLARTVGPNISWVIGWNLTPYLHRLEGGFVATLQSFAWPALTAYFSSVYVYGYVFLLVFPVIAYLFHDSDGWLRRLAVAYSVNYAVGLGCYVLFVAYGPRNLMPSTVEALLYTTEPTVQILTREINTNTNVFPSLHTSLSVTVALFAYRTRSAFPRWYYLAVPLALSVVVSTMYLGIHWATDVVAGILLAFLSVRVARRHLPFEGDDHPSLRVLGRSDDRDGPDESVGSTETWKGE